MSLQARLTSFLMRRAQNRDGTAPSLERDALSASQIAEVLPKVAMPAGDAAGPARPTSNDIIAGVLSEKVLHGWSQNRNQTLHPLTLNFATLSREQSVLLLQVAVASMLAAGPVDAARLQRAETALALVHADDRLLAALPALIELPMPFHELVEAVRKAHLTGHAVAVTMRVNDQSDPVNRDFTRYLSSRLSLPPDMLHSIARRYQN